MQECDEAIHMEQRRRRGRRSVPVSNRDSVAIQFVPKQEDGERKPKLEPMVHEITLKNQVMFLSPPVEEARKNWYSQLHHWLGE